MNATATLKQLARRCRLTCTYGANLDWDKQEDWHRSANGYRCTLRYHGRQYTFDFWMGSAHTDEPDAEGVLKCLLSDAQAGDEDFDNFCMELGYDQDSRKSEAVWKSCQRVATAMHRLLGDDYDTFLYADRD